jgi:hypothetical protein
LEWELMCMLPLLNAYTPGPPLNVQLATPDK